MRNEMPKKVDHDAYRLELAQKAAVLFSEHGYSGLGMRNIASELGISKSALYHYFPTKQDLFIACTKVATDFSQFKPETRVEENVADSPEKKIHALFQMLPTMEASFPNELSLLVDYLRTSSSKDVANDESRQIAKANYLELIGQHVNKENETPVLCLVLGTLLLRYFDGSTTKFEEIESWLLKLLEN